MRTDLYYGFEARSNGRIKVPGSALLPIHLIESESESGEGSTVIDLSIMARVAHNCRSDREGRSREVLNLK
jgi:hypothetical protein